MNANNLNTLRSPKQEGDDDPWEALSKDSRPGHLKGDAEEEKGDKPYRARHFKEDSDGQSGEYQPRHLNENAETEGDELYLGAKHLNTTVELVGCSIDNIDEATEEFCRIFKGYETNILEAQNLSNEDKQIYRGNPELIIRNFVVVPLKDAKTPEAQKAVLDSLKEATLTPAPNETDTSKDSTDSAPNKLDGSLEALRTELASQIRARVPENRQAEMIANLQNMSADKLKRAENVLQVMESLKDGEYNLADTKDRPSDAEIDRVTSEFGLTPITTKEEFIHYPPDKFHLLFDLLDTSPQGVRIFRKVVPEDLWNDTTRGLMERAQGRNFADWEAAKKAQLADGTYAERIRERQNRQGVAALEEAVVAKGWGRDQLSNIWNSFASNPKLGEGKTRDDAIEAAIETLTILNSNNNETDFAKNAAENLADYELGSDVENHILNGLAGYCGPERIAKIKAALKELRGSSDAVQNPSRDDLKVVSGNGTPNITAKGSSHEQSGNMSREELEGKLELIWNRDFGTGIDTDLKEKISSSRESYELFHKLFLKVPVARLVEKVVGFPTEQIVRDLNSSKIQRFETQLKDAMAGVDDYTKRLAFSRVKNGDGGSDIDKTQTVPLYIGDKKDFESRLQIMKKMIEEESGDGVGKGFAEKVGDRNVWQLLREINNNKGSFSAQELPKLLDFYLSNPESVAHDLSDSEPSKNGELDLLATLRLPSLYGSESGYLTLQQALERYEVAGGEAQSLRESIEEATKDYPVETRVKLAKKLNAISESSVFREHQLRDKIVRLGKYIKGLNKSIEIRESHRSAAEESLEGSRPTGGLSRAHLRWIKQTAERDLVGYRTNLAEVKADLKATQAELDALMTEKPEGAAKNNPQPTGNNGDNMPSDNLQVLTPKVTEEDRLAEAETVKEAERRGRLTGKQLVTDYIEKNRAPEEKAKIRDGMEQMLAQSGTSEERNRLVDELNRYGLPPEYRDAYMREIDRTVAMHKEARDSQPAVNRDENAPPSGPSVTGQAA